MSEKNPKAALDAILETEKIVKNIEVKPITLARYGLLELLDSPFILNDKKFTVLNLIPSFYVMTHDFNELKGYNSKNIEELEQKSLEWAETQNIDCTGGLIEEIFRQLGVIKTVSPDSSEDPKSKKEDAPGVTAG